MSLHADCARYQAGVPIGWSPPRKGRLTAEILFDIPRALSLKSMPFVWLFALLVLLVGNGCANRERQADSSSATLVAEDYLRKSRRAQPLNKRIGLLLGAAHISWKESGEAGSHDRARQIYNAATAKLAVLLMEAPSNATISVRGPAAGYRVRLASGNGKQGIWEPRFFTKILLPRASKVEALREVVNPEGFGGILVGIRKVEDPDKWFLPRAGVSAPVTVIADFENKSPATYDVTLTWYDPTRRDRALVASRKRPLRGGFGAALAYYPNPRGSNMRPSSTRHVTRIAKRSTSCSLTIPARSRSFLCMG